ncbi:MAG: hypothetical protein ACLBM1_01420 [Cuspidothrix sp.]
MSGNKRRQPRNEPTSQPPPTPYQKNQPIWKTAIIQILRGTIGILETTVVKLETETPADSQQKNGFFSSWDRFLRTFRLFLPSSISNNLSDRVLTGIFAVLFVVTIGITTFTFIPKSVEIATVPPVEEVTTPSPVVEPEPTPTPVIEPEPTPTPVVEPEPTPTPVVEPEPTPTPVVELTPEESLLAAIENQFAEISIAVKSKDKQNMISQLIKPIEANFRTSDLKIKIKDIWYNLEKYQQDKLAADILQRSQELNFTHLEVVDSQDKLIARSPVIGNQMIIFNR